MRYLLDAEFCTLGPHPIEHRGCGLKIRDIGEIGESSFLIILLQEEVDFLLSLLSLIPLVGFRDSKS